MNNEIIYLDNNATTPLDERVLDAMLPYFRDYYANAASSHYFGNIVSKEVENAREKIAELINASVNDLIFTSGATESINLAIKGLALSPYNNKKHIVTVATEHKAVLDTCKYLETLGFNVTYLPVNREGLIDINELKDNLSSDTLLTAVMHTNNETGVIQDLQIINQIVHDNDSLFLCDATQAVGKLLIDVQKLDIDCLTFSAHKFYGPKGIGALYINRKRINKNKLVPLIHGGGHEQGLRSGTLNVPAIIGFGKACEIAAIEMELNSQTIERLRNELEIELLQYPGSFINGGKSNRIFSTLNICLPGLDANVIIGKLKDLFFSNGSACTSSLLQSSHVLKAMGLSEDECNSSLRLSLNKYHTSEIIKTVIGRILSK